MGNTIPEYILIAIINGVNFYLNITQLLKILKQESFMVDSGENLSLDIQNYMLLNQINKIKIVLN